MSIAEQLKRTDISGPANNMETITPADDGTHLYRSFFLPVAGEVKFTPYGAADDSSITVTLPAGYHPVKIKRVWAATSIDIYGLN